MKVSRLPKNPGPAAWDAILPTGRRYPELESARRADWLVVGAGFAGLAAARQLRQLHPKDDIVLLDARRIAEGPVGRNSGFMIDLPHNLVSEDYAGAIETDRILTGMNRMAISFAQDAANDYGFASEAFVRSGKTNAAASDKGTAHNHAYAAHLSALGEAHELYDAARMKTLCGSSYYQSGLYTPGTAMLQPALYAREMAAGLAGQGVLGSFACGGRFITCFRAEVHVGVGFNLPNGIRRLCGCVPRRGGRRGLGGWGRAARPDQPGRRRHVRGLRYCGE